MEVITKEEKIALSEEKISFVKTKMILDMPFFGIVISKLNEQPNFKVNNIGIDGKNLIYSPDFILHENTTENRLLFIFLHEVFHLIFNHLTRRNNRDIDTWNIACDIAVNNTIITEILNSNVFENIKEDIKENIIEDYIYDLELKDLTAEEIYELIKPTESKKNSQQEEENQEEEEKEDEKEDELETISESEEQSKGKKQGKGQNKNENKGSGDGNDSGGSGEEGKASGSQGIKNYEEKQVSTHSHWNEVDKDEEDELYISIRNAYEITKTHSHTLGFIEEIITDFFQPKQNWKVLLSKFVEPIYPDYSFNPPSHMFPTFDFIMPEERSCDEGIVDIYFYIDSSGSVPEDILIEMATEIKGCYEQFGDKSVIYYGDWAIKASEPKLLEDPKNIKFEMSGGTDPTCIFNKLKELDKLHEARAIIIITDGYFEPIPENLSEGVEVLWVIVEDGTGEYLHNWDNVIFM